jgi:hypothetical protein
MRTARAAFRAAELSIGVVGFGGFGQLHCKTVQHLAGVTVGAVIDPSHSALATAAKEHPAARCFTDLTTALREHRCDAYIVASSSNTHVRANGHPLWLPSLTLRDPTGLHRFIRTAAPQGNCREIVHPLPTDAICLVRLGQKRECDVC